MDYEKLYKEAFERARAKYAMKDQPIHQDLADIFPELVESEDERIKEKIIATIHLYYGEPQEMITWLEKQGQTFTKKDVDDAYLKGVCDAKHELEKQGEQKFEQKFFINDKVVHKATGKIWTIHHYLKDTNSYYVEDNDGLLHHYRESELKLVEQKPADKVEPKFEIGNWVVCGQYGAPCQIESIKGGRYYFTSGIGIPIESVNIDYHLWTFQDAKAGDVLVDVCDSLDNPLIFIFKDCKHIKHELATLSDYHSFCYLKASEKQEFCIDGWHNEHNLMPATKEQRDLLFQKMKESGYEWDTEKLELKKVEQKHVFDVEIPFGTDSELVEEAITIPDGCYAIIEDNKVILRKGEKKPAEWSEEDEAIYYGVIETEQYMLDVVNGKKKFDVGNVSIKEDCTRELDWLNSLKGRVLPQPKQEWSKEDEQLYNDLSDTYFYNDEDYPEESYKLMLKRVLDWMTKRAKSLRLQSQWKPSDEQMDALRYVTNFDYGGYKATLVSLYEQLKKIREE